VPQIVFTGASSFFLILLTWFLTNNLWDLFISDTFQLIRPFEVCFFQWALIVFLTSLSWFRLYYQFIVFLWAVFASLIFILTQGSFSKVCPLLFSCFPCNFSLNICLVKQLSFSAFLSFWGLLFWIWKLWIVLKFSCHIKFLFFWFYRALYTDFAAKRDWDTLSSYLKWTQFHSYQTSLTAVK